MTYEDDLLIFQLRDGPIRLKCKELGIAWPPPGTLRITGAAPLPDIEFTLLQRSNLTDADRAKLTRICRCAVYVHRSMAH